MLGAPAPNLPADNFSARWRRRITLERCRYRFWTVADDGVRAWVDGAPVIDQWRDAGQALYETEVVLEKGEHEVVVEFYERGEQALVRFGYDLAATPTPTATWTPVPSPTPTATATPTHTDRARRSRADQARAPGREPGVPLPRLPPAAPPPRLRAVRGHRLPRPPASRRETAPQTVCARPMRARKGISSTPSPSTWKQSNGT